MVSRFATFFTAAQGVLGDTRNLKALEQNTLAKKYALLLPHLDERQTRLYLATEANFFGHGGIRMVSEASGVSATRIKRGLVELEQGAVVNPPRARRSGGGRKPYSVTHPEVVEAVLRHVEAGTRGDPMAPLLWTSKSTRALAAAVRTEGFSISHDAVSDLLREHGYSLQANTKVKEGNQHVDRDAQFQHINEQTKKYIAAKIPVLSLDCKKKELIGEFKNGGQEWLPKGEPTGAAKAQALHRCIRSRRVECVNISEKLYVLSSNCL